MSRGEEKTSWGSETGPLPPPSLFVYLAHVSLKDLISETLGERSPHHTENKINIITSRVIIKQKKNVIKWHLNVILKGANRYCWQFFVCFAMLNVVLWFFALEIWIYNEIKCFEWSRIFRIKVSPRPVRGIKLV